MAKPCQRKYFESGNELKIHLLETDENTYQILLQDISKLRKMCISRWRGVAGRGPGFGSLSRGWRGC